MSPSKSKLASVSKLKSVKRKKKTSEKDDKTDSQWLAWYSQKRFEAFGAIVGITLLTIIVFGGLGWIIDHYAGTKPIFLIILLFVSFPVTQILLYKKIQRIAKSK